MEKSRREFVRVNADCPILYRSIPPEGDSPLEKERFDPISSIETHSIAATMHSEGDHQNSKIIELLLWIDWKVNYLIKERSREKERARFPHEAVMVDLSATGMRFSSHKKEEIHTRLQFQFLLPILPFKEMTIDGEVIHLKEKINKQTSSPDYEIGVAFSEIKPVDQDSLFSYILKREMQLRHEERELNRKEIPM